MRVSTAGMHWLALQGINARTAALARAQEQIASGRRLTSPADDPAAAVHIVELERALAASSQYGRNAERAVARLSFEEQTLADGAGLLQRVRELAVQANNATLDAAARQMIAAEIEQRLQELVDLANRRDASGEYLFAGYASATQPFVRTAAGVSYQGDQGVRLLQTSPTQRIADGHPGSTVFVTVPAGNATFVTGAAAGNTGTGTIDGGMVSDPAAWIPGDYTVRFTAADTWEARDAADALVSAGSYVPGGAIAFNGVQVSVSGAPAAGDAFIVTPAGTQDVFTTLGELLATLRSSTATPAERARSATELGSALSHIDRALERFGQVRAEVGARLAVIEQSQSTREGTELELQRALSQLRDLDYTEALTRMNQQYAGLQAAQAAYARFAQLSLFDYL